MRVPILIYCFLICCFSFTSCRTTRVQKRIIQDLKSIETQHHNHMGLYVYDLDKKTTLIDYRKNSLFIPASNLKIITLYAALENLGDSLLMFKYTKSDSSLCIRGQANPTLLHPAFDNSKTLAFLKTQNKITFDSSNYFGTHYASGWAWDDYGDGYQVEMSSLPVYGNVAWLDPTKIKNKILPDYFENKIIENSRSLVNRKPNENIFYLNRKTPSQVPFITSAKTNTAILSKKIGKPIGLGSCGNKETLRPFYESKADTVYRKMMFESDNMLAEHLLLQASLKYTDSLSTTIAIEHIRKNLLAGMAMRWVDGAGLSRYNLISPAAILDVLEKMQSKHGFEKTISLFPQAGKSGTLKAASKNNLPIFAKSGSMGGVFNMSGYIISKKGNKMAFSFMSNNALIPLREVRAEMMTILEKVIATY